MISFSETERLICMFMILGTVLWVFHFGINSGMITRTRSSINAKFPIIQIMHIVLGIQGSKKPHTRCSTE